MDDFLKQMAHFRSDFRTQIDAKIDKILEKLDDIQRHLQMSEMTNEEFGVDLCVANAQPHIQGQPSELYLKPTSISRFDYGNGEEIEESSCVEVVNEFSISDSQSEFIWGSDCFVKDPNLAVKVSEKMFCGSEIDVQNVRTSSDISSNTLSAIVKKEIVLNHFTKGTSAETMKLLDNGWVSIGFYGVVNDPNGQNYLFLNECFEVRKVNGGPDFNFRYRRKMRWSCEWRGEWLILTEKFKLQFVSENYTWYLQPTNRETRELYGKVIRFPVSVVANENWFQVALNTTNGCTSVGTGWKNCQDDVLFSSVGLDGNDVVYIGFRMKLLRDCVATEMTLFDGSFYLITTDWEVVIHGLPIVMEVFGNKPSILLKKIVFIKESDMNLFLKSLEVFRASENASELGDVLLRSHQKLSLEFGGNACCIIFDDAYLDVAMKGALATKFKNSGQTCVCENRVLVQEILVGPLSNGVVLHKVNSFVQDVISKGAKVLTSGKKHNLGMTFYEPTMPPTDIKSEMILSREEIFEPVAPLQKSKIEAAAIRRSDDTNAGSAAYILKINKQRSWRVSEALEYGLVGVNEVLISAQVVRKEKYRDGGRGTLNCAKHVWVGVIVAMVSKTIVAPLERVESDCTVHGEQMKQQDDEFNAFEPLKLSLAITLINGTIAGATYPFQDFKRQFQCCGNGARLEGRIIGDGNGEGKLWCGSRVIV